jgi:hypothetical protein
VSEFRTTDTDAGWAIVDEAGAVVAYASQLHASSVARLLRVLDPSPGQLAALLEDARLLYTIELRHPSVCRRCGEPMPTGSRARWNAVTKLTQHLARCPSSAAVSERKAAA